MFYEVEGRYYSKCDECHKTREFKVVQFRKQIRKQLALWLCKSCQQRGERNRFYGKKAWNKGLTEATSSSVALNASRMRATKKARGHRPSWNSGRTYAELKGERWAADHSKRISERKKGVPNLRRRGMTSDYATSFSQIRRLIQMRLWNSWGQAIRARDNFSCVLCGASNIYLEVHHLKTFRSILKEVAAIEGIDLNAWRRLSREDVERLCQAVVDFHKPEYGITVCTSCHKSIDSLRVKQERRCEHK